MTKMNGFNKINDSLIVDAFASLSIQCHTLNMLVGHLQKESKSVSSESDLFSTCLWILHHGMKRDYCGCICQQLHRLHEACALQHSSRYLAILRGRNWRYKV